MFWHVLLLQVRNIVSKGSHALSKRACLWQSAWKCPGRRSQYPPSKELHYTPESDLYRWDVSNIRFFFLGIFSLWYFVQSCVGHLECDCLTITPGSLQNFHRAGLQISLRCPEIRTLAHVAGTAGRQTFWSRHPPLQCAWSSMTWRFLSHCVHQRSVRLSERKFPQFPILLRLMSSFLALVPVWSLES